MQSSAIRGSVSQEFLGSNTALLHAAAARAMRRATNRSRGSKEHWETSAPAPDLLSKRTLLNGS